MKKLLNVVYMHYHFRSGGVTSVIQRQIKSLKGLIRPFLLIGEKPELDPNISYSVIPSLAYDRDRRDNNPPEKTAEQILKTIKDHFGRDADLLHIHNPTLGKNKDFIDVINYLMEKEQRLLLQIHDFAEDGRSENYQLQSYPQDVHYAVLNSRDYNILRKAGLVPDGLHLLPNPVEIFYDSDVTYSNEKNNLILYPVRAIRRKNIGEAILISLFIKGDNYIGITLEPTSEIDTEKYNMWRKFSSENDLKVKFRVGIDTDFLDLMRSSKMIITTSIKEGFGMTYLEPWIYKKMLLGRRLPDICQDFSSKGIDLSYLYDRLFVPVDWIEIDVIKKRIIDCHLKNLKSFGIQGDKSNVENTVNSLFSDNFIDFGIMDEENQMRVIDILLKDRPLREEVLRINKKLKIFSMLNNFNFSGLIEKNRSIVKNEYSIEKNKNLLIKIYQSVIKDKVKQSINKKILIKEFNSLERISLLLCS